MYINHFTNAPYTGSNHDTLASCGFVQNRYATFVQWQQAGYKVIKGSKGIRLARVVEYSETKAGKVEDKKAVKGFVVFNISQVTK